MQDTLICICIRELFFLFGLAILSSTLVTPWNPKCVFKTLLVCRDSDCLLVCPHFHWSTVPLSYWGHGFMLHGHGVPLKESCQGWWIQIWLFLLNASKLCQDLPASLRDYNFNGWCTASWLGTPALRSDGVGPVLGAALHCAHGVRHEQHPGMSLGPIGNWVIAALSWRGSQRLGSFQWMQRLKLGSHPHAAMMCWACPLSCSSAFESSHL